MNNNYLENILKRYLKRKVKITLALITVFLITGSIGYGSDSNLDGNSYKDIYGKIDYRIDKDGMNDVNANEGNVIINSDIVADIYGGFAKNNNTNSEEANGNARALSNNVEINNINGKAEYIYGGSAISSGTGNLGNVYANSNNITIKNSIIEKGHKIVGGYIDSRGASSKDSQTNYNKIIIDSSNIDFKIVGGFVWTQSNGNPTKEYDGANNKNAVIESNRNTVIITNNAQIGTLENKKEILGGYIEASSTGNTAESIDNTVDLSHSTVYGDIYGTYIRTIGSSTGNSKSSGTTIVSSGERNKVNINDSKIYGDILGARVFEQNNNLLARFENGNESEIKGIKILQKDNQISIENNSYILGSIYGVYVQSKAETTYGNAEISKMSSMEIIGNKLTIDTSTIGTEENKNIITGGYGISSGGGIYKEAGDIFLTNNNINIKNSIIYADIYGGYGESQGGYKSGIGNSGNVSANENQISIDSGTINGDVYGAYVETKVITINGKTGQEGKLEANNNVITIKGISNIENSNLYGSNLKNDKTVGNKLIIDSWSGKANSINNFNNIEFQNINWQNNSTVLEIINGENALKNTKISLLSIKSGAKVENGDSMYFVKSSDNLGTDKNKITLNKDFTLGLGLEGSGELIVEENGNILYKIGNIKTNEQVNLLAENRAVSLAFVNQGEDLIKQALNTMEINPNYGFKSFFATQGNRSKYDVDSDIKINGWSIVAGLGKTEKLFDKKLDWAVFYENGIGNYRTYNNFNQERFNGSGELEYRGGGIASRYYHNDDFSIESSVRVGKLSTGMDNALMDSNKNMHNFDFDTLYYSFHVGMTKNIKLSENRNLDIYSKYSYTYTDKDDVNLDNQNFKFDSAKSNKIDLGFRVNENRYDTVSLYYGAAFEYEFDGKADMSIDEYSVPTQSLKGDTYIAELGLKYKPNDSSWKYDINIHGYTGEREGITGTLNITYEF